MGTLNCNGGKVVCTIQFATVRISWSTELDRVRTPLSVIRSFVSRAIRFFTLLYCLQSIENVLMDLFCIFSTYETKNRQICNKSPNLATLPLASSNPSGGIANSNATSSMHPHIFSYFPNFRPMTSRRKNKISY